ncbi:hypothetical protein Hypma_010521 [Hypsizygus marmoreus]|uniref:HNH nuclease domain-containing protein n=1 Tax=Hypsizygus marmoreus TaxID=39966 RepID=A0A369JSS3_HYPMA|nr:hypothetical protein Hypma_010521 [Hypsizygus marmoreus]
MADRTFFPALHPRPHHTPHTSLGTTLGPRTRHFHAALAKYMCSVHAGTATHVLADAARACIVGHRFIATPARAGSIDAAAVAGAMLRYARETGGERAERYVAGAVVFCAGCGEGAGEALDLVGLADMWVMCFLWPVKASHRMREPLWFESELPTPTDRMPFGPSQRADVMRRDGSRCVVTGLWDAARMPIDALQDEVELVVTPIVHPGIGAYTRDKMGYEAVTWDIITNYAGLDAEDVCLDSHGNAILLEPEHYEGFAALRWCFVAQDEEHTYRVENVPHTHGLGETHGRVVRLWNYAFPLYTSPSPSPSPSPPPSSSTSPQYPPPSTSESTTPHHQQRRTPLTPPNPKLIALHAAAARVLQASGAGTVLERVMGHFPEPRWGRGCFWGGWEGEDEGEGGEGEEGGRRGEEEGERSGEGEGIGEIGEEEEEEGEGGEGGLVCQLIAMLAALGMLGV